VGISVGIGEAVGVSVGGTGEEVIVGSVTAVEFVTSSSSVGAEATSDDELHPNAKTENNKIKKIICIRSLIRLIRRVSPMKMCWVGLSYLRMF
jgi:hypothetical protein